MEHWHDRPEDTHAHPHDGKGHDHDDDRDEIIELAKRVQDDNRYGAFTNPVVMGMLMAVQVMDHLPA